MNRIRKLRREKELTLTELSEQVGIQHSTLSLYETGKREPKLKIWQKIADALDVSPAYLMGLEDNEEENSKNNKTKEFCIAFPFGRDVLVMDNFDNLLSKMQTGRAFAVASANNGEKTIVNPNTVLWIESLDD